MTSSFREPRSVRESISGETFSIRVNNAYFYLYFWVLEYIYSSKAVGVKELPVDEHPPDKHGWTGVASRRTLRLSVFEGLPGDLKIIAGSPGFFPPDTSRARYDGLENLSIISSESSPIGDRAGRPADAEGRRGMGLTTQKAG